MNIGLRRRLVRMDMYEYQAGTVIEFQKEELATGNLRTKLELVVEIMSFSRHSHDFANVHSEIKKQMPFLLKRFERKTFHHSYNIIELQSRRCGCDWIKHLI